MIFFNFSLFLYLPNHNTSVLSSSPRTNQRTLKKRPITATVIKSCIIINFRRTWVADQPRFFLMWSCKGKRMFSKILMLKNRKRNTFTRPIPPFKKMIVEVARHRRGFPLIRIAHPIKNPKARLPASPIRTWLG